MVEIGLCGPIKNLSWVGSHSKVVIPDISKDFSRITRIAAQFPKGRDTCQANEEKCFHIALQRELSPEAAAIEEGLQKAGLRWQIIYHVFSFLRSTRTLNESLDLDLRWSAHVDLTFMPPPQTVQTENFALEALLEKAWQEHPDFCLRQILRLCEWKRRWNRFAFYDAAAWLWQKHPPSLLANLQRIAEIGSWRDLRDLLARVCEGSKVAKARDQLQVQRMSFGHRHFKGKSMPRFESVESQAQRATRRYAEDLLYRALFDRIAELFAGQLKQDLELVKDGRSQPSFCAKWCPGLDTSFDRRTLLCEGIARKMFPRDSLKEYAEIEEHHYAYRIRDRLRREVLVPLKRFYNNKPSEACKPPGLTKVPISYQHGNIAQEGYDCSRSWRFLQSVKASKQKTRFSRGNEVQASRGNEVQARALHESVEAVLEVMQWAGHSEQSQSKEETLGHTAVALAGKRGMTQECACNLTCREVAVATAMLMGTRVGPFHNRVMVFPMRRDGDYLSRDLNILRDISDVSAENHSKRRDIMSLLRESDHTPHPGDLDLVSVMKTVCHRQLEAAEELERTSIRRVLIFSSCDIFSACRMNGPAILGALKQSEQLFQSQGMQAPEIFFWDLVGGSGLPVIANGPGIVLLSGFSLSLFDEVIATSSFKRIWNPARYVPRSLAAFVDARVIRSKTHSEEVIRACLGIDCTVEHKQAVDCNSVRDDVLVTTLSAPLPKDIGVDICVVAPTSTRSKIDELRRAEFLISQHRILSRKASISFGGTSTEIRNFGKPTNSFPHQTNLADSLDLALSLNWQSQFRFLVLAVDNFAEALHFESKQKCHWARLLQRFCELRIQVVVILCADRPATWRWSELSNHATELPVAFIRCNGNNMSAVLVATIVRNVSPLSASHHLWNCAFRSQHLPKRAFVTVDLESHLQGCDKIGRLIGADGKGIKEVCKHLIRSMPRLQVRRVWLNIAFNDCHGSLQRGFVQVIMQGTFPLNKTDNIREALHRDAGELIYEMVSKAQPNGRRGKNTTESTCTAGSTYHDRGADDYQDYKEVAEGARCHRRLAELRKNALAKRTEEPADRRAGHKSTKRGKDNVHHHGPGKAWQSNHVNVAEIVEEMQGRDQLDDVESDASD